jgi:RimJ/RimL family protein N-acetyltransferase
MNAPSSTLRTPNLRLLTPHLELVAATVELAQAEINDLASFVQLLDTPGPNSWPPPLNDEHSQQYFLASLQKAEASDAGWNLWFCIRREPRELIGNVGFKGGPKDGLVEIGYSMLEMHQRHGYATEAVRGLLSLGISEARSTKGCCRYSTEADAINSCAGKIRVRVCRRWARRGWYADDSLRIDSRTVSSACLGVKFYRNGKNCYREG